MTTPHEAVRAAAAAVRETFGDRLRGPGGGMLAVSELLAAVDAMPDSSEYARGPGDIDTALVRSVEALNRPWVGESGTVRTMRRLCDGVDRLRSQRDAEYARGLEAAARVADADRCGIGCCDGTEESIAARIRALRPTDDGLVVVPRAALVAFVESLAAQQAMPDDSWRARLDALLKDPR